MRVSPCVRLAFVPLPAAPPTGMPHPRTRPSRSISTVLKALCQETGGRVIIKAYHKSKMHPKHFHKLQRELYCMRVLKGAAGGGGGTGGPSHVCCCYSLSLSLLLSLSGELPRERALGLACMYAPRGMPRQMLGTQPQHPPPPPWLAPRLPRRPRGRAVRVVRGRGVRLPRHGVLRGRGPVQDHAHARRQPRGAVGVRRGEGQRARGSAGGGSSRDSRGRWTVSRRNASRHE